MTGDSDNPFGGGLKPGERPAFLDPDRAEAIGYVGADTTPTFDHEVAALAAEPEPAGEKVPPRGQGPSRGYEERWRAIARYHALGFTNNQIGEKLGYSPAGISLALKKEWVQAEAEKFRQQYFDSDIHSALKAAGPDAIRLIHKTILDDSEKAELRSTNSRWLVEKLTGKAKQEVSVESNTLSAFLDTLRQMQDRGESLDDIEIEANPGSGEGEVREALPAGSRFSKIVDDLDLD